MRVDRVVIIIGVLLTLFVKEVKSQTETYSIESNIIYYFTKYIDWPEEKKTGNFIIGILGSENIYNELNRGITGRRVGNQRITISKIEELGNEKFEYSILFIGADKSSSVKNILEAIKNKPVLIVTEKTGMILKGASMNLIIVDGKVKLEINKDNIEARGLKIAAELLAFDKDSR